MRAISRKRFTFNPTSPRSQRTQVVREMSLQWGRGFSAAETWPAWARPSRDLRGFNGAAAFQPRKLEKLKGKWRGRIVASMGPRLFSRGNPRGGDLRGRIAQRFNGAAAFQPRKPVRRSGRSSSTSRFNGAAAFQPRKPQSKGAKGRHRQRLQWGRGFSAAETGGNPTGNSPTLPLQWGRGFSAAETPRRLVSRHLGVLRFNGAAAFQPRKLVHIDPVIPNAHRFNGAAAFQPRKHDPRRDQPLGRGSFNGAAAFQPRKRESRRYVTPGTARFNGAAAFQPRKLAGDAGQYAGSPGFNGAAAFQPRKPEQQTTALTTALDASMGPRLFSRGNDPLQRECGPLC